MTTAIRSGATDLGLIVNGVEQLTLSSSGASVPAATATAHAVRADQIQAQSVTAFTTGGTGTAFTLTPTPAITAYAANQTFNVIFNAACGAAPTLQISGIATPPNLVRQLRSGAYQNLIAGDFPSGWQSNVKLVSASQALVMSIPPRLKIITSTRDMTAASGNVAYTGVGFVPSKITAYASVVGQISGSCGMSTATSQMIFRQNTSGAISTFNSVFISVESTTAAAYQTAVVATMDNDGFTLTWTKINTPAAGTCDLQFFCEE